MYQNPETSTDALHAVDLLTRLCDREVQSRPELAGALCSDLVALDVMYVSGDAAFAFRPRHLLAPEVVEAITELGPEMPLRYFIARRPSTRSPGI